MSAVFLDSNILVYAYSADPRSVRAMQLLAGSYTIGVQTLNEFAHVATRKLKMSAAQIVRASEGFAVAAKQVLPTTLDDHRLSLDIATRHRLSLYDALMVAIALRAGCTLFHSEDMHPGLVLDGRMTLSNPFA